MIDSRVSQAIAEHAEEASRAGLTVEQADRIMAALTGNPETPVTAEGLKNLMRTSRDVNLALKKFGAWEPGRGVHIGPDDTVIHF